MVARVADGTGEGCRVGEKLNVDDIRDVFIEKAYLLVANKLMDEPLRDLDKTRRTVHEVIERLTELDLRMGPPVCRPTAGMFWKSTPNVELKTG